MSTASGADETNRLQEEEIFKKAAGNIQLKVIFMKSIMSRHLHKRTSLFICQRILLVLHLLRYKVYLVHNFSSEDSSSGDERQASDLDDKSKTEQTSCKLELTASQVKFMLEDSD